MEKAVAVRCDANSIEQAQSVLRSDLEARAQVLHAHSDSATFNQEITAIWEVRHLLRHPALVMSPAAH